MKFLLLIAVMSVFAGCSKPLATLCNDNESEGYAYSSDYYVYDKMGSFQIVPDAKTSDVMKSTNLTKECSASSVYSKYAKRCGGKNSQECSKTLNSPE